MKLSRQLMTLASAIIWIVVSCETNPSQVWAESSRQTNEIPSRVRVPKQPSTQAPSRRNIGVQRRSQQPQKQKDLDFSGYGRPGRRVGGGSRSPCPAVDTPLTALIPDTNWATTVAERPTFWFYVPYSPQAAGTGEFVLQDEENNDIYRTPFKLTGTPGFVSLGIPHTQPSLGVNKWYRWYFKLYCEPQKLSTPIFVQGWVQRLAMTPELERRLKTEEARQYTIYAEAGIWYNALATLAKLRLEQPGNPQLNLDWANLLGARGIFLGRLNDQPLVGSVILFPSAYSSVSKPVAH